MVIATIADQIVRGVDAVTDTLAAPFGDPVIRLGVTGLSRAGKTGFHHSIGREFDEPWSDAAIDRGTKRGHSHGLFAATTR